MARKHTFILALTFASFALQAAAQDDLMNMLKDGEQKNEPVFATFKSGKIINANTTEFLRARNLDFRVGHRFDNIGGASGGNVHNLWGFQTSTDIRIAFEYGITDDIMAGISRNKFGEMYEGFLKFSLLRQTTNNKIPVSVALFTNTAWTGIIDPTPNKEYEKNPVYRASYVSQLIIARKFNRNLSLVLLPTFIHRNYVTDPKDENNNFAIGGGGRLRVSRSSAIIADYFYTFSKYRGSSVNRSSIYQNVRYYPSLGLGWEIETGGHVFTLMFSNNAGIIENSFLVNTTDSWKQGGFKFSFNISRVFKL